MVNLHGMVPDDFTRGIIIPLIKNNEGNKTSSDNYRGITMSPVLSKLFEMVLLSDLQKDLYSAYSLGLRRNLAVVKLFMPYDQ